MNTTKPEAIPEITSESLRRALRGWDSSKLLGEHPLVGLRIVAAQRREAGYSDTPAGWGLALRETLQSVLQSLRPAGEFDSADRRWRPYFILTEQYIHGRLPEWVASQLCISRRTYFNEQEEALETVADLLRQREERVCTAPPPTEAVARVPFLAPPRPAYPLVGRGDMLAALKQALLSDRRTPLAIWGLPGVGKSSLAIELAHDPAILAHFSDGVLWAGLGRRPDLPALLNVWAAALGLPLEATGRGDLAAGARLLQAAIGMRRMLLIIDDAWKIEDALAFRLGGPNCATLLTTRLPNLAADFAGEGGLHLNELDPEQGLNLLAQLAPQATAADPGGAGSLVAAAGGLPLALILIGRHLRSLGAAAGSHRLGEALEELQKAGMRLQLEQPQSPLEQRPDLPAGTPLSLQAVIGVSDAALPAEARAALHALALFPSKPDTFPEDAALAVADVPHAVLDTLVEGGLVESVPPERYTLHQTICDYARLETPAPEAVERYIETFVRFAAEHTDDHDRIDGELSNLIAALDLADHSGQLDTLQQIIHALHPFLLSRGLYNLEEQYLEHAIGQARATSHLPGLGRSLCFLGTVHLRRGRYDKARSVLQESLELARQLDNAQLEADCLQGLGNIYYYTGEYETSRTHSGQALEIARALPDMDVETRSLNSLGLVAYEEGNYNEARAFLEQALKVSRQSGSRSNEGINISNLGLLLADQGDYGAAVAFHRQALEIARELGNVRLEGSMLDNLSFALVQLGCLSEARTCYERALDIFRQIGNQQGISSVLAFLAALLRLMGEAEAAEEHAKQAIELAGRLNDRYSQGMALTVLGDACTDLGRLDEAAGYYRQSMELWNESRQLHLSADPLAGLARLDLKRGDLEAACRHINEVLACQQKYGLDGVLDLHWTALTCVRVLSACGDSRARTVLEQAHARLQEQAARIDKPELRRSFLEDVPSHRELAELYRQLT